MNLTELSKTVHAANEKWWQNIETGESIKRNKGELLALIHSEISEGYDGEVLDLMDDKLPHRKMGEVELIDAAIRIFDYAAGFGHDIGSAARKVGVSEFIDLNHFIQCVMPAAFETCRSHAKIHSSISKVLELERKGKPSSEVSDALCVCLFHIFDYAHGMKYDMQGAYFEKTNFNRTRQDHTHEARKIAGGKQF